VYGTEKYEAKLASSSIVFTKNIVQTCTPLQDMTQATEEQHIELTILLHFFKK